MHGSHSRGYMQYRQYVQHRQDRQYRLYGYNIWDMRVLLAVYLAFKSSKKLIFWPFFDILPYIMSKNNSKRALYTKLYYIL